MDANVTCAAATAAERTQKGNRDSQLQKHEEEMSETAGRAVSQRWLCSGSGSKHPTEKVMKHFSNETTILTPRPADPPQWGNRELPAGKQTV